jgi:hypothetical protein
VIVIAQSNDAALQKIMLVYDAVTGQRIERRQFEFGEGNQCVRMSPDKRHAILVNDTSARIVDFNTGSVVRDFPFDVSQHFQLLGVAFTPIGNRLVIYGSDGLLNMMDVESGVFVDSNGISPLVGGHPIPFGLDRSGKQVLILRSDQQYGWSVFPTAEDLIETARAHVPICISPAERTAFYLPVEPPDWCIELAKIPYNTDDWRRWLAAKKTGKTSRCQEVRPCQCRPQNELEARYAVGRMLTDPSLKVRTRRRVEGL